MNLIFNELSYYPLAENEYIVEARFKHLLETFKEFKNEFGFNHIRFQTDFRKQEVIKDITFEKCITNLSNRIVKDLILGLCKTPFTDELEENEMIEFFKSDYQILEDNIPTCRQPFALPVAHIKSLPTISFNSYPIWEKRKINIKKTNTEEFENICFASYNISNKADVTSKEFIEWQEQSMSNLITSKEVLNKYLSFTKYKMEFTDIFMDQLFEWKKEDNKRFKYLLTLMKDVQIHPFTGGMGKTENLKNRGKEASKRITLDDRLSYTLENNVITFLACKGHYNFH